MLQIRKNLVSNILSLSVNLLVGLLYTPYLVRTLGAVAYGVIPLALLINQYISILTESLTGAITRFYSVEYQNENYHKSSSYFSSSIIISVIIALVMIPICWCLIQHIDILFVIPDHLLHSAKILFFLTVCSFFTSVVTNCINVTIYSNNRLDLINSVKIVRNISKVIVNLLLFYFFSVDIVNVGISFLASELLALLLSVLFFQRTKLDSISFSLSGFNLMALKPIWSMILWVSLICLANVIIYKIDSLFVNRYFGLYDTGVLGAISEFCSYCNSITAIAVSLYRPLILISYSKHNYSIAIDLTMKGGFVICVICTILCGTIIGLSKPILSIWLGPEYEIYSPWLMIKMAVLPLAALGSQYSAVYNFWNKVKIPALLSLMMAAAYFFVSATILRLGFSISSFLIIGDVFVLLQALIISSLMIVQLYSDKALLILKDILKGIVFMILVSTLSYFISRFIGINNILVLIVVFVFAVMISIIISIPFFTKDYIYYIDILFPIKKIFNRLLHNNSNSEQ